MSDMMWHDCFIGHGMSHGSNICFRVHIRVHIASLDTIEHGMTFDGMTWIRIRLCSHMTHRNVLNHEFS